MSLLAVPGARPIAPARGTRPRRALVSASVVSKKSTDAVGRARVVSRVSCRPTGRRAVRVSCRASADAGDADDEALPWKPTSILADLTSGDGPTETERRPNRLHRPVNRTGCHLKHRNFCIVISTDPLVPD